MSSTLLLPPRAQLCNRSCSNKTHTHRGETTHIGVKPGSRSPGAEPQDRDWSGRPPGRAAQDHMYPFGIIGVAPRYIPAGAVSELAGIRLSCTSTPTSIRKKHRRGESNPRALIPASDCAPLRQKSLGDCTRPRLNQYQSWIICVHKSQYESWSVCVCVCRE